MRQDQASLVALLVAAYLATSSCDAIKCYVCQSNVDPKCADPFDNLTLPITDCDAYPRADLVPKTELDLVEEKRFFLSFSQPAPVKPLQASMCRKIRQKVAGDWRTIRGCGYLDSPGATEGSGCKIRHGTDDIFMESCVCNSKDGCNAAANLRDSSRLFALAIALTASLLTAHLYQY